MTDRPGEAAVNDTDAAVIVRRVELAADAIATNTRGHVPVTDTQRAAALALALDLHATAARHGVTRTDLDAVVDFAGSTMHAIRSSDRRRAHQAAREPRRPEPQHNPTVGPQL